MRKGQPKSVLDKTFQKSKSGRCEKKNRTRAANGQGGSSNREILKVINKNIKYKTFTARFTMKAAPKTAFESEVNSAYFNIYICSFPTIGSKSQKLHFKVFKKTRSILDNVGILDFKKDGNMLEALEWGLHFNVLRHLKNLR